MKILGRLRSFRDTAMARFTYEEAAKAAALYGTICTAYGRLETSWLHRRDAPPNANTVSLGLCATRDFEKIDSKLKQLIEQKNPTVPPISEIEAVFKTAEKEIREEDEE